MPPELELVEVEGAAPPDEEEVEDVVAGLDDWVDELEDCVAGLEAGVEELEEFEPQAAIPRAATSRRPAASRRVNLVIELVLMSRSLVLGQALGPPPDASRGVVIPETVSLVSAQPGKKLRLKASLEVANRTLQDEP
jgi:hypothetical protein